MCFIGADVAADGECLPDERWAPHQDRPTRCVASIGELAEGGFIARSPDPADGPSNIITITRLDEILTGVQADQTPAVIDVTISPAQWQFLTSEHSRLGIGDMPQAGGMGARRRKPEHTAAMLSSAPEPVRLAHHDEWQPAHAAMDLWPTH
ncbi:MAG: hypothetical protein ACM3ML_00550 [Micromonosporaceae bacterium]